MWRNSRQNAKLTADSSHLLGFAMINLEPITEQRIIKAASESGLSVNTFLDRLVEHYLTDKLDIQIADFALTEAGEISLDELKVKYDL